MENMERYSLIKRGDYAYKKDFIKKQKRQTNNNELIEEDELVNFNSPLQEEHICVQFYTIYKQQVPTIIGIFEIKEIKNKYFQKNKILFNNEQYKIFKEYYDKIKDDPYKTYDSFEKYKDNDDVKNLVEDAIIDYSSFDYKKYYNLK